MIYKTEIDDCSFIEAESCSIDKYVHLHIVQEFEDISVKTIINFELNEKICRDLIKALRFSLDDLNS